MRAKKGAAVLAIRGKFFDLGRLQPARATMRAAGTVAATVPTKDEMYNLLSTGEQGSVDDLILALFRRRYP